MPIVHHATKRIVKSATIETGKEKNRTAKKEGRIESYVWQCTCGNKQIMHIRCSDIKCSCNKRMTCANKEGVL